MHVERHLDTKGRNLRRHCLPMVIAPYSPLSWTETTNFSCAQTGYCEEKSAAEHLSAAAMRRRQYPAFLFPQAGTKDNGLLFTRHPSNDTVRCLGRCGSTSISLRPCHIRNVFTVKCARRNRAALCPPSFLVPLVHTNVDLEAENVGQPLPQ